MKKVHDKHSVAHLWANKIQDQASTPSGNLYFNGDTIYSYGSHFPIARHIKDKPVTGAGYDVMFTLRTYSVTTTQHLTIVRQASSHLSKLYVWNFPYHNKDQDAHEKNIIKWMGAIRDLIKEMATARKPEARMGAIEQHKRNLLKYIDFYGLKLSAQDKVVISLTDAREYKGMADKQAAIEKAYKDKVIKQGAKIAAYVNGAWKSYKNMTEVKEQMPPAKVKLYETYLRLRDDVSILLRTDGKEVETSKGVKIPVPVAKRIYTWFISTPPCTGDCNHKILDYTVTAKDEKQLIVGCHTIPAAEIKEIATVLKF